MNNIVPSSTCPSSFIFLPRHHYSEKWRDNRYTLSMSETRGLGTSTRAFVAVKAVQSAIKGYTWGSLRGFWRHYICNRMLWTEINGARLRVRCTRETSGILKRPRASDLVTALLKVKNLRACRSAKSREQRILHRLHNARNTINHWLSN